MRYGLMRCRSGKLSSLFVVPVFIPTSRTCQSCEKGPTVLVRKFCASVVTTATKNFLYQTQMDLHNPTTKQYKNNYNNLKRNYILADTMNGFLDKMKKASKGVVDAGAKTMLKVRHCCCMLLVLISKRAFPLFVQLLLFTAEIYFRIFRYYYIFASIDASTNAVLAY